MDDRAVVERQLGRSPRAFRRVVARCPFGLPAITEQAPYDANGRPFPTTYYVTCPHLVSAIARLEAAGGVERWSREASEDAGLAESLARATEEQRRIRRELAVAGQGSDDGDSLDLGIGGSRSPAHLKCLHAHVAFAIALRAMRSASASSRRCEAPWPAEHCCSEPFRDDD